MKELLKKLKEAINEIPETIQFSTGAGTYHELILNEKGEWKLFTLLGKPLRIDLKKLKDKTTDEVEEILKTRFKASIY